MWMIIGIYGYPDAGKTNFVERLIGSLVKKGYTVSSVKHTPHEKSMDREGKETWRHWKAGSDPVVFASGIETAIIKHSETSADEIAKRILREYNPDVLVFQGFKEGSFQKVAVGKVTPRKGTVLTNPRLPRLIKHIETEVAFERVLAELPGLDCMKCGLDCRGLAGEVLKGKRKLSACKELSDLDVDIFVDGRRIPAGNFVSSIVHKTVHGMLSSLRGYEPGKEVEIRLKNGKGSSKRRSRVG
jgi:molybdopterin-guanine dinucleotide biosynthesis adapter protein